MTPVYSRGSLRTTPRGCEHILPHPYEVLSPSTEVLYKVKRRTKRIACTPSCEVPRHPRYVLQMGLDMFRHGVTTSLCSSEESTLVMRKPYTLANEFPLLVLESRDSDSMEKRSRDIGGWTFKTFQNVKQTMYFARVHDVPKKTIIRTQPYRPPK